MYKNKCIVGSIAVSEGAKLLTVEESSKHHVFIIMLSDGRTIRQIVSRGSRQMYGLYEKHIRANIRRAQRGAVRRPDGNCATA